jgi:hypothetical protein
VITVILLVDLKPESKLWGFLRFPLGSFPFRAVNGLRFSKILGSGENGGFGLKPSGTHQGLFCVFDTETNADKFLDSDIVKRYSDRAREFFTAKLQAYSAKGSWSGNTISIATQEPQGGPIAALTRASIKPLKAAQFWKRSPPAEESLANAKGCLLAVGLGEAPIFRQATFSIWESLDAMNAYARTGAHLEAIHASLSGGHFSESMFVRFKPIAPKGVWKGRQFV